MTEQAVRAESVHNEHAHPSDHWLDEVTAPTGPAFSGLSSRAMQWFAGPARLMRRCSYFASTTPGKLFTVTLILTVALGAAGLSMSQSSAARHSDLDELLSTTALPRGPLGDSNTPPSDVPVGDLGGQSR